MEYLYGDTKTTRWGALRSNDGHPAPYQLPSLSIELGNEACMSNFAGTFAPKIARMEAVAQQHGQGGRLRYVTGSYLGITAPSSHCPAGGPNATLAVLKEVLQLY